MIRWLDPNTISKKRVLVRVDFNVPLKKGYILDDFRIRAHMTTFKTLLKKKNTLIILTHIGKPDGKRVPSLSAKPIADRLSRLVGKKVELIANPFAASSIKNIKKSRPGSIFLIENVRFWKGEEKNDPAFAKKLARLGEVFVEDAFGAIHRPHASIIGIPRHLPSYGGLLLKKETEAIRPLTEKHRRPFIIIMGGAKISTKLGLIKDLMRKADRVLLGGALANTALAALGFPVGRSLVEKKSIAAVRKILQKNHKLLIPHDFVVSSSHLASKLFVRSAKDVGKKEVILDIGPITVQLFMREIKKAKTILWNGPLGVAEKKRLAEGTIRVAKYLARLKAYKVIGGGDLVAIFKRYGLISKVSHVATGGGAALALVAGESLVGLQALENKKI